MKTSHSLLATSDGISLHVTDYLPALPVTARIMLMHGLGEHSGRYRHVADFFCARGFAVRTYDHRGHGHSGGARGDVPDDDALLNDAALVWSDWISRSASGVPPFLFGHSMGGLFAARFATSKLQAMRGLILSSAALALPLSGVQKLLLKTLAALAPGLAVSNGLKQRFLSHDLAVVEAYRKDPLVHDKITARLLQSMLTTIAASQRDAAELACPTLLLFSGDDHLVDAAGSRQFFEQLANGVGSFHQYDDLYHEIFNELNASKVFADLGNWLDLQLREPA
jgi:alpha-beta hydrolase superfamily lysophospholipase